MPLLVSKTFEEIAFFEFKYFISVLNDNKDFWMFKKSRFSVLQKTTLYLVPTNKIYDFALDQAMPLERWSGPAVSQTARIISINRYKL